MNSKKKKKSEVGTGRVGGKIDENEKKVKRKKFAIATRTCCTPKMSNKQGRLTKNYMTCGNQHVFELLGNTVSHHFWVDEPSSSLWNHHYTMIFFDCCSVFVLNRGCFIHSFCVYLAIEGEVVSFFFCPFALRSIWLLSRISLILFISIISIDAKPLFKHFY